MIMSIAMSEALFYLPLQNLSLLEKSIGKPSLLGKK